jgi:hypothetical protein
MAAVLSGRRGLRRKSIESNRRNGTLFKYLAPSESADERVVIQAELEPLVLAESALVKRQLLILQSVARAVAQICIPPIVRSPHLRCFNASIAKAANAVAVATR